MTKHPKTLILLAGLSMFAFIGCSKRTAIESTNAKVGDTQAETRQKLQMGLPDYIKHEKDYLSGIDEKARKHIFQLPDSDIPDLKARIALLREAERTFATNNSVNLDVFRTTSPREKIRANIELLQSKKVKLFVLQDKVKTLGNMIENQKITPKDLDDAVTALVKRMDAEYSAMDSYIKFESTANGLATP